MEEMHPQKVRREVLGFCARSRNPQQEEDARLMVRCEAKIKEWTKHWQCNEEVQNLAGKPWTNEELEKLEEAQG